MMLGIISVLSVLRQQVRCGVLPHCDSGLCRTMYPHKLKVLPEPSDEDAEKVWVLLGFDPDRREEAIQTLKDWVQTQPHLPKNIEDCKYRQIFIWSKNSIQRSKDALDMYYTLRTALPELYSNRDPKSEWFEKVTSLGAFMPLPRLTEKYERVCIFRAMASDLSDLDAVDATKMALMVIDIRSRYDTPAGDIYIVDLKNISAPVLAKFTPTLLKKLAVIAFKAYNTKIKGIHLVNTPAYIDAFVTLLKAVFNKPKVRERIHVHPKGMESLHDFVNKKVLPEEYGGDGGPVQQYWDAWKETLVEFRDWFLEQEDVKADESKRPQKALTSNDLFGFEGSFRQLSMD